MHTYIYILDKCTLERFSGSEGLHCLFLAFSFGVLSEVQSSSKSLEMPKNKLRQISDHLVSAHSATRDEASSFRKHQAMDSKSEGAPSRA